MQKISSGMTLFYKRILPACWFGFLILFVVKSVSTGALEQGLWFALLMPLFMGIFGYFLMKNLLWDLADEVHDLGDALLIKRGDDQERVALSNIMNVSASMFMNPPRVTLRFVQPGKFGSEITFSPARRLGLNPFAKDLLIDDLILRVDRARAKRHAS